MKKIGQFLQKYAQIIVLIFAAVGLYGIATSNAVLAFFGGALWGYFLNEAQNQKIIREMRRAIDVLERYIDKRDI